MVKTNNCVNVLQFEGQSKTTVQYLNSGVSNSPIFKYWTVVMEQETDPLIASSGAAPLEAIGETSLYPIKYMLFIHSQP